MNWAVYYNYAVTFSDGSHLLYLSRFVSPVRVCFRKPSR
jgi:hypothetical protein